MADDPNRDIVPVKEGSCIETCRSTWGLMANPRERHAVCKLDRYELEDRYLRLLDEAQALKKLSNAQEDKLKCLTTRLMRISASSRPCIAAALTIDSDRMRIEELERENSKLKDRIIVLKTQIVSHKGLKRSPPRRCVHCNLSRPTTCRSEGARTKISTSTNYGGGKNDFQHQNDVRIDKLHQQRQEMISRISKLEDQLMNCQTELQKTKVNENIEYIRMLRQIKQQEEQLASKHSINTSLDEEVRILKQQLDEISSKNGKISAALQAEKNRMTEFDETLSKSMSSQLALREKDEQINDLMNEIKILQQNNNELISLSTKNSEVELENMELRKKISEQQVDNHNLRSAFKNEQTNITALQAVNTQLSRKLHELQKEMDTMTIQLKSFQNKTEKPEKSDERKLVPKFDKTTITSPRNRRGSPDESNYSTKNHEKKVETAVQTESTEIPAEKFCSTERLNAQEEVKKSPLKNQEEQVETMVGANLSRDEILKLLDQAQINVPLESHNAAKMRQFETFSPVHRQRQSCSSGESLATETDCDPHRLIQNLCGILKGYNNVIVAKIQDKHSDTVDRNNNANIQTSTPKKRYKASCACNDDVSPTESCGNCSGDDKCPCDNTNRSVTSDIDDIRMCLEKTIDTMEKQREKIEVRRYEVLPKPQNRINCRQSFSPDEYSRYNLADKRNSFHPMLVTNQQGLVEIHISSLQLSSFAIDHLFGDLNVSPSLFIGCDLCGQGSIFSPTQTYPNLIFNSSCAYRVPSILNFLDCLHRDFIHFQVHIVQPGGTPCLIAHGKMSVKDILDYPQNKLHYIVNMECSVPCYRTANFGQIVFWIRLSCDVNRVRMFKQQRKKLETSTNSEMRRAENESKPRSRRFSQQEFKSPESSLDTLHTIHDSRRRDTHFESITKSHQYQSSTTSTSERIDPNVGYEESRSDNFQSRTDSWRAWSSGDYSGRRKEIGEAVQLQQQINSGFPDTDNLFDDTNTVITDDWGRYKRKSLNSQMTETGDAVVIRIERLSLFPRCTLLNDRDVKQLYVEFSFLGNHGPDLETVSVPIPRSSPYHLYFNYMKKFDIDTKIHSDQRKKLEEMLSDEVSSTVKFTIVNEPLMEEMETKDCVEVGHAYLNLKEHVLNGGSHDISLKVSNIEASDTIGSLKITVLGADAIRKCITQD